MIYVYIQKHRNIFFNFHDFQLKFLIKYFYILANIYYNVNNSKNREHYNKINK